MLVGGNCDEKDLVFSSVGLMHSSPLQGGWEGGRGGGFKQMTKAQDNLFKTIK